MLDTQDRGAAGGIGLSQRKCDDRACCGYREYDERLLEIGSVPICVVSVVMSLGEVVFIDCVCGTTDFGRALSEDTDSGAGSTRRAYPSRPQSDREPDCYTSLRASVGAPSVCPLCAPCGAERGEPGESGNQLRRTIDCVLSAGCGRNACFPGVTTNRR